MISRRPIILVVLALTCLFRDTLQAQNARSLFNGPSLPGWEITPFNEHGAAFFDAAIERVSDDIDAVRRATGR